jgi:hypothetical protein
MATRCSCGLIHGLDFRLVDGRIEFCTRRDNRTTAAARRREARGRIEVITSKHRQRQGL